MSSCAGWRLRGELRFRVEDRMSKYPNSQARKNDEGPKSEGVVKDEAR
jgi:hypothetical protein